MLSFTGAIQAPLTPKDVQTFSREDDRARLSPVGAKAFLNLQEAWKLTNHEAADLLGVSDSTIERMRRGKPYVFNQDQFTRISALVGIYKGLHLLFADKESADLWVRKVNSGPLFGKRSPITAMIDGGIPLMLDVRRYIDAVRGGL